MDEKEWTSLDWIRDSIDIDKHNLKIYVEDLDIHNMQNVTQELKYLKMTETDLEVLEILKKYVNIANSGFTICGNYYDEKDFKKEDFRKIKEWLNK